MFECRWGVVCWGSAAEDLARGTVYALAEKYDVPPLRALAKAKFTALVCRIRRHEDFSPVFLAIYESSVRRGLELRVIVSRICASRMRAVIDNAQLNGSVKENGNLGRHGSIKKEVERRMRELGLHWRRDCWWEFSLAKRGEEVIRF